MKTKYSLLIIAALFALAVGVAAAQMGMGRMGAGPMAGDRQGCGMHMRMFAGLDLTADQKAQLQKINTDYMTANAPLRADMMARHKELAALLAAPVLDEAAIRAKRAEIEHLRAQMNTAMTDRLIASLRVLTPDQRAKLGARMTTAPAPGQRRGMGRGPGAGKYGGHRRGPGAGTTP